ncbi:malto-oligosyltrehalose trehalohydrolase [Pseudomonas cannabina pv. alisalensis]|uniref:Malto-oligosyltrehalose trehalohydrolase n=3 Tax=Pseudomonas syringae group TaxID=136849 RepID=A0A8T8C1S1_PSEYM|nr:MULTISPECIES: malto-oligosyltrehalose trehalohydrolase [Pseudomonas syringae group]MBM0138063.1 malto-oligosyltrehalose trehalohydrolase [Pseudomonas cannabina pv. alisalensis]QHE97469.1 malto-oligosyltrehalose trehalohydrolase [Pseudomonas syringae pv. maculicola str. ES4326]RMN85672.1 Malto-oligosyltrehalose trehalohydrolase [Pseudomonas cannabina pv. alisalensis]RMN87066.1 Malto-oligosyltrehalose trehalohydrolase [Pseudomonas cannabina]UBY98143.1 malto-oligosyltrehalose trehalohydrolase 
MPLRTDDNWRHGAVLLDSDHTRFALWAPDAEYVSVELQDGQSLAMLPQPEGWFVVDASCKAGTRYRFKINHELEVPDPASRAQAGDVHAHSVVVDPAYSWQNTEWKGRPWHEAVIYELHVGAMGGYAGVEQHVPRLAALGITAIELMPLAQFPGDRNWGYDGVLPYAPQSSYGTPEQLKHLIDTAHAHGLMVILDVVYNHFGPDGNYLGSYAKEFFRSDLHTPWGDAIDFRRPQVRDYFVDNALMWLLEYRFDGLRMDAVHAIRDETFLPEFAQRVRAQIEPSRHVWLNLENEFNQASHLDKGFDAQWDDDGHNTLHVLLTGETDAYYSDFAREPTQKLARLLSEGFVYQGEPTRHGHTRGEPSGHLPPSAFVLFLQNHDQIGNRALGERLPQLCSTEALKAATALLLLSPMIPLMFMGDEWAASEPFLFFTSHHGELADLVREGRRKEFADFAAFADPEKREHIPDPNDIKTFEASRPDFAAFDMDTDKGANHRNWLEFYTRLLVLRHQEIVPRLQGARFLKTDILGDKAVSARWTLGDDSVLRIDLNLSEQAVATQPQRKARLIFSSAEKSSELSSDGILNPYTAIVSLTARDVLEEQDEQ